MNNLRNLAAIGSILAATGCVESERIPERTTPVVVIEGASGFSVSQVPIRQDEVGIPKEDMADPVKVILDSNKKYREAMAVIGPIVVELNKHGWDGDANCHHDLAILAMQEKNHDITWKIIRDARNNGRPDKELLKCFNESEMSADCGKILKSTEMARNLVKEKKGNGEYWQALATCYQEEFKGLPVKKP